MPKIYESELIKQTLDEVAPNYPQLCEYESEWIYFANHYYHAGQPVNLEYQSLKDVKSGTIQNTIPFNFAKAMLKGETLINIQPHSDFFVDSQTVAWLNIPTTINPVAGVRYFIKFYNKPTNLTACYLGDVKMSIGNANYVIIYAESSQNILHVYGNGFTNDLFVNCKVLICEYQGGMENWKIPYFEGMQSVKMPVLKTTGKNLFDGKLELGGLDTATGKPNDGQTDRCRSTNYVKVKPNTSYIFSLNYGSVIGVREFDEEYGYSKIWCSLSGDMRTFITSKNTHFIKFIVINTHSDNRVQLEEGSVATEYEPYKSNILTVNEDVELRGIDDVKDELNLLTGELVQKTEKFIFDGSEAWGIVSSLEKNNTIFAQCFKYTKDNTKAISNVLNYDAGLDMHDEKGFRFNIAFQIRLNKNEISNITNDGVKEWVSKNNIIVVKVKEQTVKTVELSGKIKPYDGGMSFQTSSETNPPNLEIKCPVVSTGTQTLYEINND